MAEKLTGRIGDQDVQIEYDSKNSLDDIYKELEKQTKLLEKIAGVRGSPGGGSTGAAASALGASGSAATAMNRALGTVSGSLGKFGTFINMAGKFLSVFAGVVAKAASIIGTVLIGAFNFIVGAATKLVGAFTSLLSWANDTRSSMSEMAKSVTDFAQGLVSQIPLIGGALGSLIGAIGGLVTTVYQILEQNIQAFRTLAEAGIDLGSGLMTVKNAAIEAGMGLDDFVRTVKSNAGSLSGVFGGASEGAARFSEVVGQINRTTVGQRLARLGFTTAQVAEHTAKYLELQQELGQTQGKTNRDLEMGAVSYMEELDKLTRITGLSREQAERSFRQAQQDMSVRAALMQLDEKSAQAVRGAIAMFGKAGPEMEKAISELVATGGVPISDASAALAQSIPQISKWTQQLKNGEIDQAEFAKRVSDAAAQYKNMSKEDLKTLGAAAALGDEFAKQKIALMKLADQFENARKVNQAQQRALEDGSKAAAGFEQTMVNFKNAIFGFLEKTGIFNLAADAMGSFVEIMNAPEIEQALQGLGVAIKEVVEMLFGLDLSKKGQDRIEQENKNFEKIAKLREERAQLEKEQERGMLSVEKARRLEGLKEQEDQLRKAGRSEGLQSTITSLADTIAGLRPFIYDFGNALKEFFQKVKDEGFWNTISGYLEDAFVAGFKALGKALLRLPIILLDKMVGAVLGYFAGAGIGGVIGGLIGSIFGPLGAVIGAKLGGIVGAFLGSFTGFFEGISGMFGSIGKAFTGIWNFVKSIPIKIMEGFRAVGDAFVAAFSFIINIPKNIINGFKNLFSTVSDFVGDAIDGIKEFFAGIMKWIPGLRDKGKQLESEVADSRAARKQDKDLRDSQKTAESISPKTGTLKSKELEEQKRKLEKEGPATDSAQSKMAHNRLLQSLDKAIAKAKEEELQQQGKITEDTKKKTYIREQNGKIETNLNLKELEALRERTAKAGPLTKSEASKEVHEKKLALLDRAIISAKSEDVKLMGDKLGIGKDTIARLQTNAKLGDEESRTQLNILAQQKTKIDKTKQEIDSISQAAAAGDKSAVAKLAAFQTENQKNKLSEKELQQMIAGVQKGDQAQVSKFLAWQEQTKLANEQASVNRIKLEREKADLEKAARAGDTMAQNRLASIKKQEENLKKDNEEPGFFSRLFGLNKKKEELAQKEIVGLSKKVDYSFSELKFAQNDQENYKKFIDRRNALYQENIKKIKEGTKGPALQRARDAAAEAAKRQAQEEFLPQAQEAGAAQKGSEVYTVNGKPATKEEYEKAQKLVTGNKEKPLPEFQDGGIANFPKSGSPAILHGTEAVIPLKDGKVPIDVSGLVKQYLNLEDQLKNLETLRGPSTTSQFVDISPDLLKSQENMYAVFDNLRDQLENLGINITKISSDIDESIKNGTEDMFDMKKYFNELSLPKFAGGGITDGTSIVGEEGAEAVVPLPKGNSIPVDFSSEIQDIINSTSEKDSGDTGQEMVQETMTSIKDSLSEMIQSISKPQPQLNQEALLNSLESLNNKMSALVSLQDTSNRIGRDQLSAVASYSGDLYKGIPT